MSTHETPALPIHGPIARALGWPIEDVLSMSLPSLRAMVLERSKDSPRDLSLLLYKIDDIIKNGSHLFVRRNRRNPAGHDIKLTPTQLEAFGTYVIDPAFTEGVEDDGAELIAKDIKAALDGSTLHAPVDQTAIWEWHAFLSYAAESALESNDHAWCKALNTVASKLLEPLR